MRILILLAVTTAVVHYKIINVENGFEEFIMGGQDDQNSKNRILVKSAVEMMAKMKNHSGIFNKSNFSKTSSEQGIAGALSQSGIAFTERESKQIFNGTLSGFRTKRQVLKDNAGRNTTWRDGVFYTFNTSDYFAQKAFKMGIKVWSAVTCIDFIQNKNAKDKVVLVKECQSWSRVGRVGGDQLLSLCDYATEGSAVHEIGHVLGLYHTMSRYDRDNHIIVNMQNVDPIYKRQFKKKSRKHTDVFGLMYDYGSVMHYDELSFSTNNQPTMTAKDPHYQKTMGSDLISFSDIFMINKHYGCDAKCNKSTSAKCKHEGFPHPRNCSICICPSGYGGALCDQRSPGCGKSLVATKSEKVINGRLGSGPGIRDHFDFCTYIISAPTGKNITIEVTSINPGYDINGCKIGGVEIKAQNDHRLTGYRFCSTKGTEKPIATASHRVPVILFNRYGTLRTILKYYYVD